VALSHVDAAACRLCGIPHKRHATVSLWLNSGVPATEVARRAGHGVAVLLKIYAHCIDGQADAANQRITQALAIPETWQDPDDDGDSGMASTAREQTRGFVDSRV
jgi:hypothetical protein